MAHVNNARQWQRFVYPDEVQLAASAETTVEPRVTTAVGVDLSLGGVQLLAATELRVGSAVSCKFRDGHDTLTLRGHVRWSTPHTQPEIAATSRVGIEFEAPSAAARQVLQALLSQAQGAGELVRVNLPNWTHALHGVAVQSEGGVRLHVPLPSFVNGSTIKFERLTADRALEGRVVKAQLRVSPETQGLELDLLLEPCEPARKRRYMVYEPGKTRVPATPPAHDQRAERAVIPKARVYRALAGSALLGCALWASFTIARELTRQHPSAARASAHTLQRSQQRQPVLRAAPAAPLAAPAPKPPPASEARPPDVAVSVPSGPGALHGAASPETSSQSPTPAAATTISASAPEPTQDSAATDKPRVVSHGDTSEIFVPVTGSLAGLRTALWTDPPAVVVEIPDGQVALPQARYNIRAGAVVGLSVGKPKGVTQLRVYVTELLARYTASAAPGGVTIYMKHESPNTPAR